MARKNKRAQDSHQVTIAREPLKTSTIALEESSLEVVEGPHMGETFILDRAFLHIGRADWCDISLSKDASVSRHHCELQLKRDGLMIQDLSSRNGIRVGGVRVFHAPLLPSLPLKVGDTVFRINTSPTKQHIQVALHDDSRQLVGESPKMQEIFSLLRRIGPRDIPLLLSGETGTGKSTIARALHQQSARRDGPFVHVNCATLSPALIESALFGYEKGAFTGADRQHRGFFEQAHKGTLFLDEIGELPLELQPKLLDVLDRKSIVRLGGERTIAVDFRLITATHRQLPKLLHKGLFREDLFYRLAVMELEVPPLRERVEDIPLLLDMMLYQLAPETIHEIEPDVIHTLQTYLWPGNVRQFRNVVERALLFIEGHVLREDAIRLPRLGGAVRQVTLARNTLPLRDGDGKPLSFQEQMDTFEKSLLEAMLDQHEWNTKAIQSQLELSKSWFYSLLKKHELKRPKNK